MNQDCWSVVLPHLPVEDWRALINTCSSSRQAVWCLMVQYEMPWNPSYCSFISSENTIEKRTKTQLVVLKSFVLATLSTNQQISNQKFKTLCPWSFIDGSLEFLKRFSRPLEEAEAIIVITLLRHMGSDHLRHLELSGELIRTIHDCEFKSHGIMNMAMCLPPVSSIKTRVFIMAYHYLERGNIDCLNHLMSIYGSYFDQQQMTERCHQVAMSRGMY